MKNPRTQKQAMGREVDPNRFRDIVEVTTTKRRTKFMLARDKVETAIREEGHRCDARCTNAGTRHTGAPFESLEEWRHHDKVTRFLERVRAS